MSTRSMFNDFLNLHRGFDDLFDRVMRGFPTSPGAAETAASAFVPPAEAWVHENKFYLRLYVPGIDKQNIEVSTVNNQVKVRGERKPNENLRDESYVLREVPYGTFERTFSLPDGVDLEKISASYHNGTLELTIPAAMKSMPRRIEIGGNEPPKLSNRSAA